MGHPRENESLSQVCEIVDFDAAMLDAFPAETRADLLREAELLVRVFAPCGGRAELIDMADELSGGARDTEMDRWHARRLAAALKRLAQDA